MNQQRLKIQKQPEQKHYLNYLQSLNIAGY